MTNLRRRGVNLENFIGRQINTPPVGTSNSPSNNGTPTTGTTGTSSSSSVVNVSSFTPSGGDSNSTINEATVITEATGPNSFASVNGLLNNTIINQSAQSIINQSGNIGQLVPAGKPKRGTIDQFNINKAFVTNPQNNINLSLQPNNIVGGKSSLIASS